MNHNTIEQFWIKYQSQNAEFRNIKTPISYYFCDNEKDANECTELVLKGIKQATTHSLVGLNLNNESLPQVDDLAIITNWDGIPKAIVRTIKVEIVKLGDITAEYALIEGEGDKSLSYWNEVHWDYYIRELAAYSLRPSPEMEVVCEYFETIYPPQNSTI